MRAYLWSLWVLQSVGPYQSEKRSALQSHSNIEIGDQNGLIVRFVIRACTVLLRFTSPLYYRKGLCNNDTKLIDLEMIDFTKLELIGTNHFTDDSERMFLFDLLFFSFVNGWGWARNEETVSTVTSAVTLTCPYRNLTVTLLCPYRNPYRNSTVTLP